MGERQEGDIARRRLGRRLLGAVLVTSVLVLSACAEASDTTEGGGGSPTITILSPADGSDVESPVELELSATGTEIGAPDTGLMHFHVHIGDASEYQVVTSTSGSVDLPKGEQTVRVVLAQPNHNETDVSASVTVNVTSGSTGKGGYGYGGVFGH